LLGPSDKAWRVVRPPERVRVGSIIWLSVLALLVDGWLWRVLVLVTAGLEFEVYLQGIDERQEPREELLVDGMSVVGVEDGAVGELHEAAKLIVLAAR
jgi:hypothetical protein